jgi:homoserine O-acetyltransferase
VATVLHAERLTRTVGGEDIFVPLPAPFALESGGVLPDAGVRLRWHGAARAPVVLVAGGISAGRALTDWWGDVVGAGCAVDVERFAAVGFEFAPDSDARVAITPRDQARLLLYALSELGIERAHAFVGASYGGLVGLNLAALAPERLGRLCVISAAHEPAPLASAWRGVQRRIVEAGIASGEPDQALALARQLAMITYRSADEFEQRFTRELGADGRSDLDAYLEARGRTYVNAMAPQRWLSLSEAIDRCRLDPDSITVPTTIIAAESDQIVPLNLVRRMAERMPRLAALHVIASLYGHDAFLKEPEQLAPIIRSVLES